MRSSLLLALLLAVAPSLALIAAPKWDPLPTAELNAVAPPGVDGEVLFRQMDFDNSSLELGSRVVIHSRLKVWTPQGVDRLRQIALFHDEQRPIDSVEARVIKPDGTSVPVPASAIFDTKINDADDQGGARKVFVAPGLAVGDIVEWRTVTTRPGLYGALSVFLQDVWPARRMVVRIRPAEHPLLRARVTAFRITQRDEGRDDEGYYVYALDNIPARSTEKFQPPAGITSAWLFFRQTMANDKPETYWARASAGQHETYAKLLRPTAALKAKAATLTAGLTTPEAKLAALHDFVRDRIRNGDSDPLKSVTQEERKKCKPEDKPDAVLARGYGSATNLRLLFGALAASAGFDARVARICDRSRYVFTESLRAVELLGGTAIAIRVGESWRFGDPAARYYEFGHLPWVYEGSVALVTDPERVIFATVPTSAPADAAEQRAGRFTLDADGTLRGEFTATYSGHRAAFLRRMLAALSPAECETTLRDRLAVMLPGATFDSLSVPASGYRAGPLSVSAQVTMPLYAERTASRLIVAPSVPNRARPPVLEGDTRETDLLFPFAWTECDDIRITLPVGYRLESPDAPASFERAPVLAYRVTLAVEQPDSATPTLHYQREFEATAPLVRARGYASIKSAFDHVQRLDQHRLSLLTTAPQ